MEDWEQAAAVTAAVNDEVTDSREAIIDQLMEDYGDDILHFVYTYVRNQATAEDLTQEIFLKCYEKLPLFKGESSMKTWLYRIASNHCKDYLRSWHYRKISLNNKVADFLPTKEKEVEDEVITKSDEKRLADAVISLPLKYREVVFLHFYEELTYTEMSNITGINPNTLKTRLKRAKELLKDLLKEEFNR
ncbi:MAG: sigma-70 family RNA polymerase sigma factor [Bacillus sp. (in: Bacteria)]|nr:sigma-70 family RNA polymerase sigma factor [Bacillus sp. (in: firmicutes)]